MRSRFKQRDILRTCDFRARLPGSGRTSACGRAARLGSARHRRPLRQYPLRQFHHRCDDHRGVVRGAAHYRQLYRDRLGRPARRDSRRRAAQIPARRHQLPDDRRRRRPHHGAGPSYRLCAERVGPDQYRHPATGQVRDRLCRCRGDAFQALRRTRLHRRRQIDQRVAAAQRDSAKPGRTCAYSCSTSTTSMAAASATARWCSTRAT